jgi:hypothetical protein
MLFHHWTRQLKIITQKRTALKLLVLSGAIRRADVEIQFGSSRTIQPMARPHGDTSEGRRRVRAESQVTKDV